MASIDPLDTSVSIVTPENISFDYRVAGPFRRFSAFFIDAVLRVSFMILLVFGAAFSGLGRIIDGNYFMFLFLITWFVLTWLYGMVWETLWSGQTPGKKLFGLRVISVDGRPINGVQATLRNLLRMTDTAPLVSLQAFSDEFPAAYLLPTFFVGMVSMLLTKRFQRVGDLAAYTMVIIEERTWQPTLAKIDDQRAVSLAEYIPADFSVSHSLGRALSLYMARRPYLHPARRHELASHYAKPLIRQFGFLPDTSPDLLLCSLYLRAFFSDQNIMQSKPNIGSPVAMPGSPVAAQPPSMNSPNASGPFGPQPLSSKQDAREEVVMAVVSEPVYDARVSSSRVAIEVEPIQDAAIVDRPSLASGIEPNSFDSQQPLPFQNSRVPSPPSGFPGQEKQP